MFEIVGLYRAGSDRGKSHGYLFEGVVGHPAKEWDQARLAARQIMALSLDSGQRPLRIRIRPVKALKA
jgi:hypothetical protein